MKQLFLMILLGLAVTATAQSVAEKAREDKAVREIEALYAASTPRVLRGDAVFIDKMRAVIEKGNEGSLYVADKYSTFAYVVGLKDCIEEVLVGMPVALKRTEEGMRVQDRCYRMHLLKVGERVPDFTLSTPDGKEVNFYRFVKDKKCVILDFWASWCSWCRKESPNVKEVYDKYRNKGVDVISVSFDTDRERWVKAIEEDGTPWTQVSDLKGTDKGYLYGWYGLKGIPAIYLIDSEGRIIVENMRGEVIMNSVKKYLGE